MRQVIVVTDRKNVREAILKECADIIGIQAVVQRTEQRFLSLFSKGTSLDYLVIDSLSYKSEKRVEEILRLSKPHVKEIFILGDVCTADHRYTTYDLAALLNLLERKQSIKNSSHAGFQPLHPDVLLRLKSVPFGLFSRGEGGSYRKAFAPLQRIDHKSLGDLNLHGNLFYQGIYDSQLTGLVLNRIIQRIEFEFRKFGDEDLKERHLDSGLEILNSLGLDSLIVSSGSIKGDSGMLEEWHDISDQMKLFLIQNMVTFKYRLMRMLFILTSHIEEQGLNAENDFLGLVHLSMPRHPALQNLARWLMTGFEVCNYIQVNDDLMLSRIIDELNLKFQDTALEVNFSDIFGKSELESENGDLSFQTKL